MVSACLVLLLRILLKNVCNIYLFNKHFRLLNDVIKIQPDYQAVQVDSVIR